MPGEGGAAGRGGGAIGATAGFAATGAASCGLRRCCRFRRCHGLRRHCGLARRGFARCRLPRRRLARGGFLCGRLARGRPLRGSLARRGLLLGGAGLARRLAHGPRGLARPSCARRARSSSRVLRGLAFLRRLALLPTRFRSHGFCSDLLCCRSRPLKRTVVARTHASLVQACRPTGRVNCFFHYTMIGSESGNLGCPSTREINNEAFLARHKLKRGRAECPRSPCDGENRGRRTGP